MNIYLDDSTIMAAKTTEVPQNGMTVSGYGSRMPTRYMVKLADKRWRRVYAICYSNIGATYVQVGNLGQRILDYACEDKIQDLLQPSR